jgi:hypothetical protein
MLRYNQVIALAMVAAGLAGCAKDQQVATVRRGPACDTASGTATSFGRSMALLYAGTAMKTQAGEIRGELLQNGYRRIRIGRPVSDCRPMPGAFRGIGLAHCRSYAQVCGQ